MLPRRELGRTGLAVSPIGLGTVKLGRSAGVRYPAPFKIPDDDAAARLIAMASDLSLNLIDTAPAYGNAEERLGQLLKHQRDKWLICTKAGEEFDADSGVSTFDFSPTAITTSVERSLRRLRTDCVECVLLHSDGRDEWILRESGAWDAILQLRERGLIRAGGISTKTPEGAVLAAGMCDVVMLTMNPHEQADAPAVQVARKARTGVLVKKALASGHVRLTRANGSSNTGSEDPVEPALRATLTVPGVSSVIMGTINPTHLSHNVSAAARCLA